MSKIILLGDVHCGARNSSNIVSDHQLKFFEDQLFPYMKENGIKIILQSGDLFESRKFTNHSVLHEWNNRFFSKLDEYGFEMHMILGNHDLAYKNTLEVNSPSLFLSHHKFVRIYDKPEVFKHGKLEILMMPWICEENAEEALKMLADPPAKWTLGHYEIKDVEMHKGQTSVEGMGSDVFAKFDRVLSGHYHTQSKVGNIHYIGTPYETTWIDYGDPKGFHVLDTDTLKMKFVKNVSSLFNKIQYNDYNCSSDYLKTIDLSGIENTYVKVIVVNKTDPYQFDKFIERISQIQLADLKIVEDLSDYSADGVDDEEHEIEDTKSLLESYIDSVDTDLDKMKLKFMMKRLYKESLEVLQ
jgi:DNA repair exonuclease SbcCD nuclease subunit